jgi:hypothetical protein
LRSSVVAIVLLIGSLVGTGPGAFQVNATDWTHEPAAQTFTTPGPILEGEDALKDEIIPPTVSDATPSAAYAGHPVVLTGNDFLDVEDVRYNGTSVEYAVVSTNSIHTRLPATATSEGQFTVVTDGGSAESSPITLEDGPYAGENGLRFTDGGEEVIEEPILGSEPHSVESKAEEEPGPGPSPIAPPTSVPTDATTDELGMSGESFTIDFWLKIENSSPDLILSAIEGGVEEETPEVKMELRVDSDNEINFELEGSIVAAGPTVDTDTWTHVAVAYDADEQRVELYRNGERRAVGTEVAPLSGAGSLGLGGDFNGMMDQFRVWSGALSAEEIRSRMHRTIAPTDPAASERELAYRFDAVPSPFNPTVYDHSGHFRHGEVNNPQPPELSGARVGQASATATDGTSGRVGPSGGAVSASGVAPGATVQVYQFGTLDGTRDNDNPGEDILGGDGTRSSLTWGVSSVGTASADITFEYGGVALAQNPDDALILIRRDGPGASWENASGWARDPGTQTFIKTGPVQGGEYALRDGPRTITDVTFEKAMPNEFEFSFTSRKPLNELTVTVDGPSTIDAYTFDKTDFSESGSGPYTYTLQPTQTFDRGTGAYTAVVDTAVVSGRNWATGERATEDFIAFTKVQNVTPATVGEPVRFRIAVADGFASPTDTTFAVRKGGAADYEKNVVTFEERATSTPDTLRLTATVPGSLVTPRGLDYYVQFRSSGTSLTVPVGSEGDAQQDPLHLPVSFDTLSPPRSLRETLFQEEVYRMVSVPGSVAVKEALKTPETGYGAYDVSEWRLFQWDPSTDQYREFPSLEAASFQPGAAFWLVTEQGVPFRLGAGSTVNADSAQAVRLAPGWNQIGNPFGFAVPWQMVQTDSEVSASEIDGPYRRRDGRFQRASTLQPWRGYFVYNATAEVDTLRIPPVGPGAQTAGRGRRAVRAKNNDGEGYTLRATARTTAGVSTVVLGLRSEAHPGPDRFDAAKPPAVRPTTQLSLKGPSQKRSVPHAKSMKPTGSNGQTWILRLHRPKQRSTSSSVRLDWSASGTLPQGQSRYVIDPATETRVAPGKRFSLKKGETRILKVIVGTERYAKKNSEAALTQYETALRGNYPNPFDETTTLEYTLGEERGVTIQIYNVLGQQIHTLIDDTKRAGLHRTTWDGTNRYGDRVGSGVYFVRMEAGPTTETQKVVLVR